MSGKGSYFKKYAEKHPEKASFPVFKFKISEEKKKEFEAGVVLLIDKPLHWTSFDVVKKVRNAIGIKKVGHAGTLDPLATGLLIICTGKSTKKINEYMAREKEYTGSITLGAVTPTYDLESEPEQFQAIDFLDLDKIREAAKSYEGDIFQKPPVFSAIKKAGTPLYELARRGKEVELEPRPIHIHSFTIESYEPPVVEFRVVCSTGTYIRSLAHDLGQALGCGAYLSGLRRTRIGEFQVQDGMSLEEFLANLSSDQNA